MTHFAIHGTELTLVLIAAAIVFPTVIVLIAIYARMMLTAPATPAAPADAPADTVAPAAPLALPAASTSPRSEYNRTRNVDALCSWCDAPATHNLASFHDVACAAHHTQWFTGPDFPALCECRDCA